MTSPRDIWATPVHFLAFGFGSGLVPVAPGTFGTLAAIPIYLLLERLPLAFYLVAVFALFALGVWFCDRTARNLGVHDHPSIVWDEVTGYMITMAAVPLSWWSVIAGFLLFRFFDIAKPWPIRWIDQRVSGGLGIMLDDAFAALPAWLLLHLAAAYV